METISMFSVPLWLYITVQTFFKMLSSIGAFLLVGILLSFVFSIRQLFSMSSLYVLLFYLLSSFSGIGLGLMLAGIQILLKKTTYIINLLTIGISILLVFSSPTSNWLLELLPMKAFATASKKILVEGGTMHYLTGIYAAASSLVFFAGGVVMFNAMFIKAKIKGILNAY